MRTQGARALSGVPARTASGVRPYSGERTLAERGAITLEIGIHGIPVNQPAEIYDQLRTGSLEGYPLFNLDNPERYFYRRVHLGCVRAVDFLTSREKWDGKTFSCLERVRAACSRLPRERSIRE